MGLLAGMGNLVGNMIRVSNLMMQQLRILGLRLLGPAIVTICILVQVTDILRSHTTDLRGPGEIL